VCYVGRLKGSKWEAGSQNRCKTLANTRLDLRNAANSLQIEGKGGATWRPIRFGGGDLAGGRRDHIYVCIYICQCTTQLCIILHTPVVEDIK